MPVQEYQDLNFPDLVWFELEPGQFWVGKTEADARDTRKSVRKGVAYESLVRTRSIEEGKA